MEQLGLKPPGTRALQNRQIDDQPDTRQPETLRLERIEERIQPIQHLNQTGIDVETQNSNRLGLQSHEALSAPNAAAKRAAQPEDGSSKISKRIKSEKPVSGSGTRTEPFHVEDYESASDKEEVGYSSSKRANKAGPSEAAFANSQTSGECSNLDPMRSSSPLQDPDPNILYCISDLSPSNDWDASKVSSWLFKTTPIPKGSMGILYDIGLTSNISDFLKEQNYLDEDFKKVLALESFSKLRRNGWSFFNVCRLFKILEMKIPSSKEREENGVL